MENNEKLFSYLNQLKIKDILLNCNYIIDLGYKDWIFTFQKVFNVALRKILQTLDYIVSDIENTLNYREIKNKCQKLIKSY